jgi:hypothetical protein
MSIHPLAALALKAVALRRKCGRFAAWQFAFKHGVAGLYRKALQLEAVK